MLAWIFEFFLLDFVLDRKAFRAYHYHVDGPVDNLFESRPELSARHKSCKLSYRDVFFKRAANMADSLRESPE